MSQLQHAAFIGARRNDVIRVVALLSLLFALGCRAGAEQETADHTAPLAHHGPHPVTAELIAEHASIQPHGSTRIGVHFDLEDGWHIYADPSGEAGLPTTIMWSGECATFETTQWPHAKSFEDPGNIRTFGYTGSVIAYAMLHNTCWYYVVNDTTKMLIRAKARWLACREICVPGSADLDLSLPIATQDPIPSIHAEFFTHADQ